MAAASRLLGFFSFVCDHPKLYGCLLLLLLAPPLFRLLLYFTPLLLSTALCVFALLTINPYVTATDAEVERESRLSFNSRRSPPSESTDAVAPPCSSTAPAMPSSSASPLPASMEASVQSWLSWMKGLNDIGRAWLEDKLREQGMALSEPASRETLISLLQGSFSEFVAPYNSVSAAQDEPAEGFCRLESKKDTGKGALEQKEPPVPAVVEPKETTVLAAVESEITEACDETENDAQVGYGQREVSEKLLQSSVVRGQDVPEETQRVLEASRRIIDAVGVLGGTSKSKDEQPEKSSAAKLLPSRSRREANAAIATGSDASAAVPSSPSLAPAKLPRKLLEESTTTTLSFSNSVEPSITFGPVIPDPFQPSFSTATPAVTEDGGPKFDGEAGDGDEELEVEEAQALVRSEYKMMEMEIEEVAAKLPKVNDIVHNFQKTPSASSKHSAAQASTSSSMARSLLFK